MSTASPVTDVVRTAAPEIGACAVCPHALTGHDRISLRFCQATQAAVATRGCVCPT